MTGGMTTMRCSNGHRGCSDRHLSAAQYNQYELSVAKGIRKENMQYQQAAATLPS